MTRPNIVFVMSDDHAAHSISAYGSRVNTTPHMDRLAEEGARMDAVYCTNSICTPSRASILTGTYSHINRAPSIYSEFDYRVRTFPEVLQDCGYQTARYGKWHLGRTEVSRPRGFDDWRIYPGQGDYVDLVMNGPGGEETFEGYATDIVTAQSLEFLEQRDPEKPFCLLVHHKAPHRPLRGPGHPAPGVAHRLRAGGCAQDGKLLRIPWLTVTNPPRNTSITSAPPIFNSGLSGDRLRPFFGAITRSGR